MLGRRESNCDYVREYLRVLKHSLILFVVDSNINDMKVQNIFKLQLSINILFELVF